MFHNWKFHNLPVASWTHCADILYVVLPKRTLWKSADMTPYVTTDMTPDLPSGQTLHTQHGIRHS